MEVALILRLTAPVRTSGRNHQLVYNGWCATAPISEKLSWFAGANAGWGRTEMKAINKEVQGTDITSYGDAGADDVGLSYSAEIGLKYDLTSDLYIISSAGVRGVWTTPNWPSGYRSDQQFGTSAGIGLGWRF